MPMHPGRVLRQLKGQGINARAEEARTYHGLIANRIVATGTEEGADLIVMGSRSCPTWPECSLEA